MTGEPILSFDKQTWQCALPERISGPYEGSQLQNTLSAKACNFYGQLFEVVYVF